MNKDPKNQRQCYVSSQVIHMKTKRETEGKKGTLILRNTGTHPILAALFTLFSTPPAADTSSSFSFDFAFRVPLALVLVLLELAVFSSASLSCISANYIQEKLSRITRRSKESLTSLHCLRNYRLKRVLHLLTSADN
jgi:hypothetical protein